ncbi:EAL domain-containing protein [Rhodoblastus sp. 17X3]|uniref:putative bifunctional diguanylate cyclase/phosphodiesterase n=1 Tax=Rhodoblastus sp. 17X3 TaxID=3047026 RepID=UPI0024B6D941|nr:EAL domain-containing protein [Rhodoblastus sp. 17X3]MDI9847114.1 EAL domain-containing protein [Rhodoblastus sp. 17X3]
MTIAQAHSRVSVGTRAPTPAHAPAKGSNEGRAFFDAAPALTLGGAVLGFDFGLLSNFAGWALIAAAGVKIGVQILESRVKSGATRFPDAAHGLAGAGMAAALGFLCLSVFLMDAPASIRTAAAISTVGYAVLAAEREASRPRLANLQAACALGLFAVGLALTWDKYSPVAIASTLSLGFALFMATRRRSRGAAQTAESGRRFTVALNSMSQCVGMFDFSGRLIAGNSQFHRMFRIAEPAVEHAPIEDMLRKSLGLRIKDPAAVDVLCEAAAEVLKRQARECVALELSDSRFMEFTFQTTPDGFSMLIEDVTARRASELRVERLARIDDLTGLSNRTSFRESLERATAGIGEASPPFAVMMVDLDRFKHVNDSLGHPVGDKLLQRVAKRMQEMADPEDVVARLGGDEFVFLRFGGREDAARFAASAVETLSEPYLVEGAKLMIGASIGIAVAPDDATEASDLMKAADMALYAAKDAGRGAFRFFHAEMAEEARRKQEIEQDLRIGISRNELEVHYQPIVSLVKRRICGCEALVRWRHPVRGLISPADFMEIAEDSGLIVPLGEWVLRQACNDAKSWPRDVRLAVNFSGIQFARSNVAETVRRVLKETKFPASRLEMEITESVLMHDFEAVLDTIDQLRDMGMRVALDDFGAGYSSLAYLSRFRPDKVKIDQCFVRDMAKNGTALAIIKAVKAIVQELEIDMLVEGVETMQQFEILRAHGADEAQGYLFSKPRPAQEIARFVADPAQLVRGRKLLIEKTAPWVKSCERVNPAMAQRAVG